MEKALYLVRVSLMEMGVPYHRLEVGWWIPRLLVTKTERWDAKSLDQRLALP